MKHSICLMVFAFLLFDPRGVAAQDSRLELKPGFAMLIEFNEPISTLTIGNPEIVDAAPLPGHARTFVLMAKKIGETNLLAVNTAEKPVYRGTLSVGVDKPYTSQAIELKVGATKLLELSEPISTVVIGNPDIAEITFPSDRTISIKSKKSGETNLIAVNALGKSAHQATLLVGDATVGKGLEQIVSILREYSSQYAKATHDLKRTDVRKERASTLCAKLRELAAGGAMYAIRGWRGRLERLVERFGGSYTMKVELEERSILKQVFSGRPPMLYATISSTSKLLGHLVNVPVGTMIEVDGKLKADSTDCIADASLTEAGMMREPELIFEPSSIATAQDVDEAINAGVIKVKQALPKKLNDIVTLVDISHEGKTIVFEFEVEADHFESSSLGEIGELLRSFCSANLGGMRIRAVYKDLKREKRDQVELFGDNCK